MEVCGCASSPLKAAHCAAPPQSRAGRRTHTAAPHARRRAWLRRIRGTQPAWPAAAAPGTARAAYPAQQWVAQQGWAIPLPPIQTGGPRPGAGANSVSERASSRGVRANTEGDTQRYHSPRRRARREHPPRRDELSIRFVRGFAAGGFWCCDPAPCSPRMSSHISCQT